jgi:ABC-2 type transport system permease protein
MSEAPISMPDTSLHHHLSEDVQMGSTLPFWAVFKREIMVYFRSPIAYAIAIAVFFFLGLLFNGYLASSNNQFPANSTYIPNLLTFLMFLIAPLLTMRLLAEETREGTLEVLLTLPMGEWHFILGKFLAAWAYYTVLLLITVIFHLINLQVGVPDLGEAFGAYVGAWLYGGAVIAVCMIWTAVTEDQIVAAFLSAATVLVLYLADIGASALSAQSNPILNLIAEILRELGLQSHYNSTLAQGVLRAHDILYFIFVIIASLFITARIVETRRWRA